MLDKGYRILLATWQTGKQLVLQPDFKRSNKKFNRRELISSAVITEDRLTKERVARLEKNADT